LTGFEKAFLKEVLMMLQRLFALIAAATLVGCASTIPAPVVDRSAAIPAPPVPVGPAGQPARPPVASTTLPPPTGPIEKGQVHVVQKGDTLIGIALAYGVDYRELAGWNNITNPNKIELGQEIRVTAPKAGVADAKPTTGTVASGVAGAGAVVPRPLDPASGQPSTAPVTALPPSGSTSAGGLIIGAPVPGVAPSTAAVKTEPKAVKLPFSERALAQLEGSPTPDAIPGGTTPLAGTQSATPGTATATPGAAPAPGTTPATPAAPRTGESALDWAWPAGQRNIITRFTEASRGIDIGGRKGEPVLAAAAGRVMYSGVGVRGYGKLIVIKHDDTWVSAYAHNDQILVKEDQEVKRGQKIAEMGATDSDKVKLHFEIRRKGKPVDPLGHLPK
jgi:lipoprotein NlpD